MVSTIASITPRRPRLRGSAIRRVANPNRSEKTTSGTTAVSAAALIGLVGITPASSCPTDGVSGIGPAGGAAARLCPRGQSSSSAVVTSALTVQAATRRAANHPKARPATPPAVALAPTPVTTRPNTSGVTVIVSASSHSLPTGCTTATTPRAWSGAAVPSAAPIDRPTASPARMRIESAFMSGRGSRPS